MTRERWARIKSLYDIAADLDGAARDAYLNESCGADLELRRIVDSLLLERSGAPDFAPATDLLDWTGRRLGPYRVIERIGVGGMGVVYRAEDSRLHRDVAIKTLAPHIGADHAVRQRFLREGRTAAAVRHANVCVVYGADEHDGQPFLAMELIEGMTLAEVLKRDRLSVDAALAIAIQIANGLAAAHERGVIHRDVKPGNVMVDAHGKVKLLDFGLARVAGDAVTRTSGLLGTPAYMSPEQILGGMTDKRTDLWSLGAVLYEMLAGCRPFRGDSEYAVVRAIVEDEAAPPASVPATLQGIVCRLLEKEPGGRYQTAADLLVDFRAVTVGTPTSRKTRTPRKRLSAVAVVAALAAFVAFGSWNLYQRRWARTTALPEIERLDAAGLRADALDLARTAAPYLGGEPSFEQIWSRISLPIRVETDPPGAEVFYRIPEAASPGWESMGPSPVERRQPASYLHLRAESEGFAPVERSIDLSESGTIRWDASPTVRLHLVPAEEAPGEMALIPAGRGGLNHLFFVASPRRPPVGAFSLDRYEVTNEEFLQFVAADGYRRPELWQEPFIKNGRGLSREEAMREFVDATGRPGPAGWELGRYREGERDLPVGGLSWYEAAAYARFVGKDLPTVHHWMRAISSISNHWTASWGNFDGAGPRPVRAGLSLTRSGVYDLAGNVREWCSNAAGNGQRYILGGGWAEPEYRFREAGSLDAWDRSPMNGLRCIKPAKELTEELLEPIRYERRDYTSEEPVPYEEFERYRRMYVYEPKPLHAKIEAVSEEGAWRREKASFSAAYGDVRVSAHVLLPTSHEPPYQAVIVFPGADAVLSRASDDVASQYSGFFTTFLARAGRAVVYPVLSGLWERKPPPTARPGSGKAWSKQVVRQYQDFSRTLDYLKTRSDIDDERLAYFGLSYGAAMAPIILAQETRLRTAVLCFGGFYAERHPPEADPFHFAPRVRVPILLISGRSDHAFPLEASQEPFFRALGTPEREKRRVVREGGHTVLQNDVVRESLGWLDAQLGPVE